MNILPQQEKDELKTGYKKRILIVSLWAAFLVLILCSIFLLPSYIIVNTRLHAIKSQEKVNLKATPEQKDIILAPRLINQKAILAIQSDKIVSVAERIIKIEKANKFGLLLERVAHEDLAKAKTDKPIYKITVAGIAPNRESLISFEKEVGRIDFVKGTTVPVGSFTKVKDLPFTMTVEISNE